MRQVTILVLLYAVFYNIHTTVYAQAPGKGSVLFNVDGGVSYVAFNEIDDTEQDIVDQLDWEVSYQNSTTGRIQSYPVEFKYTSWRLGGDLMYFTGERTALGIRYNRELVRQTQSIDIQVDEVLSDGLMALNVFGAGIRQFIPVNDIFVSLEGTALFGSGSITRMPNYAEQAGPSDPLADVYSESGLVTLTGFEAGVSFGKPMGSAMGTFSVYYSLKSLALEDEPFPLSVNGVAIDYPDKDIVHQFGIKCGLSFYSSPD